DLLTGDPIAAERSLRAGYAVLEPIGEKSFLSTTAALLSRALFAQGRIDEADHFAEESAALAADDDAATQILWPTVNARILVEQGRTEEAERVARDAVALGAATDFVNHHADALADLAEVLYVSEQPAEAHESLLAATRMYEEKGNIVAERSARSRLLVLGAL